MQLLNEAEFNVQLRHVATETSWDAVVDHGYVTIFDQAGKQLVRRDGFQHNRKLRCGGARDLNAMQKIIAEVKEALSAQETVKIPNVASVSVTDDSETQKAAGDSTKSGAAAA